MGYSDIETLLDGETADETTSPAWFAGPYDDWSAMVTVSDDTISGGSVTIEGSDEEFYSGTWAVLATLSTAASVPANDHSAVLAQATKVVISGSDLAAPYVRARIDTAIAGGADLTVRIYGRR